MIRFKEENGQAYCDALVYEWNNMVNPILIAVFVSIARFVKEEFKKDIILTDLCRPEDPGDVHYEGRAGDMRAHGFINEEEAKIAQFVRDTWGYKVQYKRHGDGANDHIHIGVNPRSALEPFLDHQDYVSHGYFDE